VLLFGLALALVGGRCAVFGQGCIAGSLVLVRFSTQCLERAWTCIGAHFCQVDCRGFGPVCSLASRLWAVLGFGSALALVGGRFAVLGQGRCAGSRVLLGLLTPCLKCAWICISAYYGQVDCRGFGLDCSLASRLWAVLGFGSALALAGGRFAVFGQGRCAGSRVLARLSTQWLERAWICISAHS
jgi:hypothetical protein